LLQPRWTVGLDVLSHPAFCEPQESRIRSTFVD
jgi:hypothetical protein